MKIIHKQCRPGLAVVTRTVVNKRDEIQQRLDEISKKVPRDRVAGPPFCIFNFITSETVGFDVTIGLPVRETGALEGFSCEQLPPMEVLSTIHHDDSDSVGDTIAGLFAYANRYGLISDEFYREVYLDQAQEGLGGQGIELQFVIHNWHNRFAEGVERVLGVDAWQELMQGTESLEIESEVDKRFRWVKRMLERLDGFAVEDQKYEILSGCAHVFPQRQVDKLASIFSEARKETGNLLAAVDAVIRFMDEDPGWLEGGRRDGCTIYAVKPPRDRQAYDTATTDLERRQAYCFCPVLRTQMDQGMPVDYCYCGSGWFRQQWEGAIGKKVQIEIIRSVLRGDDACEFAIHLPKEI